MARARSHNLSIMLALFLCATLASGLTQYTDFVHSHEVASPAASNWFGYGIVIAADGLSMATLDPNRSELYRYNRLSRSGIFNLSATVSVPATNITHPLTGCGNASILAFTANHSVVFIGDSVQRIDLKNATSVSVSSDCMWAAVGVPSENRVSVYLRGSGGWAVHRSIFGGQGFGTSVAINRNGSLVAAVNSVDARVRVYSGGELVKSLLFPDAADVRHGRDDGPSLPSIAFSDEYLVWGASHESSTGLVLVWKLDGSLHQILNPSNLSPTSTVARSGRSVQISPDGEVICAQAFGGMAIYGKSFFGAFTAGSIVAAPSQLVVGCSGNTAAVMGAGSIKVFSSTATQAPTKSGAANLAWKASLATFILIIISVC